IKMNADDPWSTIIGVVADVRDDGLTEPPGQIVYMTLLTVSADRAPWAPHDVAFVVHTPGNPAALAPAIASAVRSTAPTVPVYHEQPLSDVVSGATARTTFTLVALGIAAALALLLGAVGLYGVTA